MKANVQRSGHKASLALQKSINHICFRALQNSITCVYDTQITCVITEHKGVLQTLSVQRSLCLDVICRSNHRHTTNRKNELYE